jgi:hypothetical protein
MSSAENRAQELHDLQKQEAELRIKSLKLDIRLKEAKLAQMADFHETS